MDLSELISGIKEQHASRYNFKHIAKEVEEMENKIRSLQRACEKLGRENTQLKVGGE